MNWSWMETLSEAVEPESRSCEPAIASPQPDPRIWAGEPTANEAGIL
jgi:hypothetical protein